MTRQVWLPGPRPARRASALVRPTPHPSALLL